MYSRGKTIAKLVNSLEQFPCQLKVGDILITADHDVAYNGVEFAQKLRLFRQRVLRKFCPKGCGVVTRSDTGRIHSHIAVEMPSLAHDFDWISFEQSERYYELYRIYRSIQDLRFYRYFTAKYRRSLPLDWQLINRKLMVAGKKYGLGRVFLTPVRKNLTAYKWYLVGNLPYKRDRRDIGVQFFTTWGLDRITDFQVLNNFTRTYRAKLRKFAEMLHLTSDSYNIVLKEMLGNRWYFYVKDMIANIDNLPANLICRFDTLRNSVETHKLRQRQ